MTYRTAGGRIVAGHRAPDADADADDRMVRLFDLFCGPHATYLMFGSPAPNAPHTYAVPRPGRSAPGPCVVDAHGHARTVYDASAGTTVLVRPDGCIGWWGGIGDGFGQQFSHTRLHSPGQRAADPRT
ncbi:hypothetical protein [Streptomyces hesseae]|uniref:Uncharacterized protein n=1 Tax=Streptomyces hesseae TaxID=3075519 RepID=A0ABU2SMX6_9ACTN|nr:hypothetical protein [Streptomyces sp. DSM 40473]MDT0449420.1 hypothetical protein [Streptomyces sp. DSM 40473]